uniref:Tetratricopeptide repeat domain 7B n=1 Tax=Petromyzon marinus TaxID=7757 RepID=S4RES9_PETMA
MASRKAGTRLELEIERCRGECQWDRIPELVKQFSGKLIASDDAAELFLGEALLEQHLKEFPLKAGSSPRASGAKLTEAKKHLTDVLNKGNLKPEMTQEAMIILGKLLYLEGSFKDALGMYVRAGLDDLTLIGAPVYKIRIIAEAYAIRGLCLEQQPLASPSRSRQSDREEEILTCYEKAGDIALLYLQEAERVSLAAITNAQNRSPKPCMSAPEQEMGYFLEVGLQSAHVLSIRNGNLTRGVGRFREILRAVETRTTQNLRMVWDRSIARLAALFRRFSTFLEWHPPQSRPQVPASPFILAPVPHLHAPSQRGVSKARFTLCHRCQVVYLQKNILFCPQENTEEALLLLLISESMANRDGVLSRTPEHNNDRVLSLQNATVVYDLLTIALGRRGQYDMLAECLERAMKFAFEEFHLWYQFALSLAAAGKSARAVKVLKECMKLSPEEPSIPLMAAKLCMGPLHWLEEGEFFAKAVVDMEERAGEFQAKGFLALGLIYSLQATDATLRVTREELQRKALTAFQRAYNLAPDDHQMSFYLALQLAISRQQEHSKDLLFPRGVVALLFDNAHALHQILTILSFKIQWLPAQMSIDFHSRPVPPDWINLLFTKVKLETLCKGPDEALLTCKHMLQIWKACYSLTNPSDSGRGSSLLDRTMADKRHLQYMNLPDFSDPETGSVHATSVAASRVEQALSEVASSLQSSTPKQGPMHPWMILTQIWLHAAEVYVGIGKPSEALACAQEAAGLFPMSHHVLFLKGQVAELRGSLEEAKRWYDEALAISPTHVRTMQKLGLVLQRLGRGGLAEKVLRDAVRVNSTAHEAWNSLGEVLQAQGNSQGATECLLAALELEATSPAVPFTVIPRSL